MKSITLACCLLLANAIHSQSVGIGTSSPNTSSVLDLGASAKPLIIPRLTNTQMNAVTNDAYGMIIYNATQNQLYGYMRTGTVTLNNNPIPVNKWQPISTGPQMIAWGVVDSFATELNGSGNFSVVWDATNNWYALTTTSHPFYKDSMMLLITPIGNGSWDQAVAIGEVVEGSTRRASIKFTDVSRIAAGWSVTDARRRSWFYFALYNLRKDPYNLGD
jgi:hypothetical protein